MATSMTSTATVTVDGIGPVPVTFTERGDGKPFLLLHGGAGLQSVGGFADLLAGTGSARVITPIHPGFESTPRPEHLDSMKGLARLYSGLIDDLGLTGVTVVGNSMGGWIAAEMALLGSPRIGGAVLVDAVGLRIEAHPVADFFSLTLDQVADLSYYNPDAFRLDLSSLPEQRRTAMAASRAALEVYGGKSMADPGLLRRLPAITIPVLAVWGAADRIVPPEHGQAFAAAIPGARFHLISDAGHLPQLETPGELLKVIWDFAGATGLSADTLGKSGIMADVSIVGPDDGEVMLPGPVRMRILEDGGTTAHRLGIGEITIAPHTDGPPQHRHAQHDEGFYVVSGTARFTVGEKSYDAEAGTLVMVPPGAPHTFANPGDEPAVILNTFTPDLYVRYFRDLRDLIASGQPLSDEAIAGAMARYATVPATEFASGREQ